jgi:hypothetical protein
MARTSQPAPAGERAQAAAWGRRDTVLFALVVTTLALVAAQFALAGFGAFTMDKTPTDNAYGAHMILGVVIGVMSWLIWPRRWPAGRPGPIPGRCGWP